MAFKNIIGQERAISILRGCITKERIPHALLFAGDEGIGKRLTAVNFAKTLSCGNESGLDDLFSFDAVEEPGDQSSDQQDSCDKCPSCMKIEKGSHPDFFMIEPEGDAGQIKVPAIRELEESLSYKPFEAGWKIAIIDDADKMNQSAANAFLRTLEEPAPQSILILISSRPDMILPTIRSRCQRINFSPLPVDTMSRLLEEKFEETDHDRATLLSTLSGGRIGYALNEKLIDQRDWSFDLFRQMLGRLEDEGWDNRGEMEEWFEWAELWLRDIAVFKVTEQADLLINRDLANEIKEISGKATLKDILKLARELYNIKGRLRFNLNKQLTFNYTSLALKKMLGKINVREQ